MLPCGGLSVRSRSARVELPFEASCLALIGGEAPGLLVGHWSGVLTRWALP